MVIAIPLAAAWVAPIDHATAGRQIVKFVHKGVAVLRLRATVNFHDGGILLAGVKPYRFQNPAVQPGVVWPINPNLFNVAKCNLVQPILIKVGEAADGLAG